MKPDLTHWHQDIATNQEEEYRSFLRALRRSQGFGLLFVRCSPAEGGRLIERVRGDLPQKSIEVLTLEEPVEKFYQRVEALPNREQIDILFVEGLELSFYEYEERKRQEGWDSKDIYSYSWKGVPPVLVNLNQQRERFRDNFRFVLVFLLPTFGIDYFIQRAPDFFDWRSGLFEFYDISKVFYRSEEDLKVTLLEIEAFLKYKCHSSEDKANLLSQQGWLLFRTKRYEEAVASFDKALELKPDNYLAWCLRGIALAMLDRHSEAIASSDKALALKPDYHEAWFFRGISLGILGCYSEAVASFDNALELKQDYHAAWFTRGLVLDNLGRYYEAVASYEKAAKIKP